MTTFTDQEMVDDLAQQLFESLVSDAPTPPTIDLTDPKFSFTSDPTSSLYQDASEITLESLTQVDLNGSGVFDKLMATMDLHIQREFKGNRITGDQYAKVYTEVMTGVLGSSVQFLLSKDQAHWASVTAQMQARVAEIQATRALIELEEVKVQIQKAIFDMKNAGAQYALTKLQLTGENQKHFLLQAQTNTEVYQVSDVLPSVVAINNMQVDRVLPAEASIKEYIHSDLQPIEKAVAQYNVDITLPLKTSLDQYQLDTLLPVQTNLVKEQLEAQRAQTLNTRTDGLTLVSGLIGKQKESINADIVTKQFNIDFVLPIQLDLVSEQREAERSKTLNTRTDGTSISGSVGKQKDLYTQQIDSFIKDAKYKTAKMYLDNWITQKTLDEGLIPPTELTTTNAGDVLAANRAANDL